MLFVMRLLMNVHASSSLLKLLLLPFAFHNLSVEESHALCAYLCMSLCLFEFIAAYINNFF